MELAEDAVQDAVVRALDTWPRTGVPPQPRAWLTLAARNRAIDLLRRQARRSDKEAAAVALELAPDFPLAEPDVVADDMLRLLFTCCHPALSLEAQTALALRALCGLTTAEVGRALLVPEVTMAKRLTRARRKIALAGIPFRTPAGPELPLRLRGVLATIYLLFNEGYAATAGEDLLRSQLTTEALRLSRLVCELLPGEASPTGLLALLLLQNSRHAARLDERGEVVLLADQDRAKWDRAAIREGMILLGVALRRTPTQPDLYATQAAIAACHSLADTWTTTNWNAIVSWYDVLLAINDTPVVRLNRAVAVAELYGAQAGLDALDQVGELPGYASLPAVRGDLLCRLGRNDEAVAAYRQALDMPANGVRRDHLRQQLVRPGLRREPESC
jgi:RNA polymerase sigma factor (sigma-70 family)